MMDGSTVTMPLLAVRGLTKRYGARIGCADIFAAQARAVA